VAIVGESQAVDFLRRRRRRRDFSEEGEGTPPNRKGRRGGGSRNRNGQIWGGGFYGRGRRRFLRPSPGWARPFPSRAAGAWDRRPLALRGPARQLGRVGDSGASGRARTERDGGEWERERGIGDRVSRAKCPVPDAWVLAG
jgi:hypothetical protein